MGGCRGMVVGTTNDMAAPGQRPWWQHRQACVRHGCEREITRDSGNLRAPLRRKVREISDASREFSRFAASHSVGYLPTAKRSDRDRARCALKSTGDLCLVWFAYGRESLSLRPFGLWRHPLPCLSLAHTNICIHIGRSVPLCMIVCARRTVLPQRLEVCPNGRTSRL